MRNLLFLLLVANLLFFLWQRFVATPEDENGVSIVRDSEIGPPLELAEPLPEDDESPEAGDESSPPMELAAVVGRSCVSVGPFRDVAEAEGARAAFERDGLTASVRTTEGEVFIGHWVQIRNIPDRATANDMLGTLTEGGLDEAYMVRTEAEGIKISLGLFDDINGAERLELQAESLGLPAEILPRMRDATVFYVDLGLPPGRGAGNMTERYGEDRVLLRDAATCPRNP